MFDHEKLDVYQLQLRFIEWVNILQDEVKKRAGSKTQEVRRQLDRASLSALLNIAEGNGKRQKKTRAKFFDDARGSISESAACLDALVAKRVCTKERVSEGKQLLLRVFSMLTKLVQRFDLDSPSVPARAGRSRQENSSSSSSSSSSSIPPRTTTRTRTKEKA